MLEDPDGMAFLLAVGHFFALDAGGHDLGVDGTELHDIFEAHAVVAIHEFVFHEGDFDRRYIAKMGLEVGLHAVGAGPMVEAEQDVLEDLNALVATAIGHGHPLL